MSMLSALRRQRSASWSTKVATSNVINPTPASPAATPRAI